MSRSLLIQVVVLRLDSLLILLPDLIEMMRAGLLLGNWLMLVIAHLAPLRNKLIILRWNTGAIFPARRFQYRNA